jgi:hypothetical protein
MPVCTDAVCGERLIATLELGLGVEVIVTTALFETAGFTLLVAVTFTL